MKHTQRGAQLYEPVVSSVASLMLFIDFIGIYIYIYIYICVCVFIGVNMQYIW